MIIALQTLVFFRHSLLTVLHRAISPYYKRLLTFSRYSIEEEEEDEEVFAEFDDEKGVVFFPPVYAQRYAAVSDCLIDERWCGKLVKIVDLGYHDMSFIKYLKDLPGVECILGVDIESIPLRCSSDLLDCVDYTPKRENPLQVTLFQGNAADPDYRLIGCDAVVAIEMIEHMLPHDLDRLVHTIFGFIKPWVTVITTPNGDFNELFKALEKNGLRRLDHFFEWTREQFHDWCSNIVSRYPQFTVTCQGIGPGPAGTEHLGCCSQLALFINKDYVKQQDLNLNSMALVSNVPSPHSFAELVDGFASPDIDAGKYFHPKENAESLTDFLYSNKHSCVTLLISSSSPTLSLTAIEHQDKTSQCNLDTELGKNFLMFNDEDMYYTILRPRRRSVNHRVYEIEDVNSRLNCTTFQARKFSKTTQNLMAKNKIDTFAHTREVVSEIRHLTKMLNFNKDSWTQREDGLLWYNINWGDNAPYWNQYYKIVREYNYPFEQKSDECRIMDLISEEINRLIDMHYGKDLKSESNVLEIPIEHIMKVVQHLTDDVDKVKDLLEWNGYEVSGDTVIHSRLAADVASVESADVDWPDETTSELDTIDGQSTTFSDGSTIVPDFHGRCLRRALDLKVQALRKMLSADEDITTELDRVVCRLMKLALRTSYRRQGPPPAKWLQYKLLDLLTLTEKAISRRKLHYLESLPKEFGFDKTINVLNKKIKEDRSARMIVDKYNHLIQEQDYGEIFTDLNFGFEDEIVEQFGSNDFFKDFSLHKIKHKPKPYVFSINNGEVSVMNDNLNIISYPDRVTSDRISSSEVLKNSLSCRSYTVSDHEKKRRKRHHSTITEGKTRQDDTIQSKKSKTDVDKKPVRAKTSSHISLKSRGKKITNILCRNYTMNPGRVCVPKKLQPTASKPIPGSLIELCHPEVNLLLHSEHFQYSPHDKKYYIRDLLKDEIKDIGATEESVLIDIIMDDKEETIALRRSVGTDADVDYSAIEQEIHSEVANYVKKDSSYDINEPSTSKGVRHIGMDVQCGTDTVLSPSGLITPPASVTRLTNLYSGGIRIESPTNIAAIKKSMDFGTCTDDIKKSGSPYRQSSIFSKGIRIEDSYEKLVNCMYGFESISNKEHEKPKCSTAPGSPRIKIKDSWTDMGTKRYCGSRPLSPSARMLSSAIMTEECDLEQNQYVLNRNFEVCSNIDELNFYTPATKSPDVTVQANDSLSNLLLNFNEMHPQNGGCRSPNASKPSNESSGIRLKDSSTDRPNYTPDIEDLRINANKTKIELPMVYKRLKTIDLVSKVSIEEDVRIEASPQFALPEQCNLGASRYTPGKSQECRFKMKKSVHVKQNSQSHHIDATLGNNDDPENKVNVSAETIDPSNILTELPRDPICNNKEAGSHSYTCSQNFTFGSSFTKLNPPVIVQNDTTDDTDKSILPTTKSYGFKVQNSDKNVVKKVEFSTTRVELLSDTVNYWAPTLSSKIEMLKPFSSKTKVEDSASECYGSTYCPSPTNLWHDTLSVNTSEFKIKQSLSRHVYSQEKTSLASFANPKLSYGGVHVHSFKEKQVSEDIVFQGEWKRHVPKSQRNPRKNLGNTVLAKKSPELVKKIRIKKEPIKEKLQFKKVETKYESKIEVKKPLRIRSTKFVKAKQEVININRDTRVFPNVVKAIKANKNSTKASSKIMTSTITSKNVKSIRSVKKPPNCVTLTQIVKNDCGVKSEPIKIRDIDCKYLPPYLRRRKYAANDCKMKLNSSDSTVRTEMKSDKVNKKDDFLLLERSNTEIIKSELIKIQDDLQRNVDYMVFRNGIENTNPPANSSHSADMTNKNENNRRRVIPKRSSSPVSQTSSTCSTSDSISTVRVSNNWTKTSRRHSTSSNKSSMANTDSETSPLTNKNRKFSKKCKVNKKTDNQSNKENLPESSKKSITEKETCLQNIKNSYFSRKNVFMSKLEDANQALSDKHQSTTRSNVKIPIAVDSNEEKRRLRTANVSKKKSLQSDDSSSKEEETKKHGSIKSDASDLVLLIESHKDHDRIQESKSEQVASEEPLLKVVDSNLLAEWYERGRISAKDKENTENAILAQMRHLVEERLDFITNSLNESSFDDNSSQLSYRTVIPACDTDLDNTLKSEIENAMNHSLDAVMGDASDSSLHNESAVDADLISFRSVTSTSRYSEYYMAESDASRVTDRNENKVASSVLDIFERKDLNSHTQHTSGQLAAQAFSGFSMNVDYLMGDQLDYINLTDSDIGTLAVDVNRQATSEEMFVSGRSSETYESCVVEEEVAVPDWLFHVMNPQLEMHQRQDPIAPYDSETGSPAQGYTRPRPSLDEDEDHPELVPLRMPMVEPAFDVNGNVVEPGVGLGAGAGDGRGMHSDHSQDSSGRGSSLSSTDVSSGPQSEAILIDPSAYTTQFELFHESVGSSMAVTTLVVPVRSSEVGRQGRNDGTFVSTSRNMNLHAALTSDGEADVSSLDTDDIPDSS